ncbi:hypothetical protein HII36_37470 [Nonomuraea sp. NN258]|uniref:hypothetical protein n=1 Tax=Nonomuraea antri TaxID=2730852 RepID=UPI001568CA57|nr:hypothetical protein [Nonomuraea antri]NRQ37482.1 hypothetical protein [Nonomuraea antri]
MIVLLLNDHLLKQAWPGFVTGKLSDVAGLVVAPPLLALLFLRRADLFATVLTGVLFTLMKTTAAGAEIASQAWSALAGPSRVLADPTDLIALPALALAWWIRRRTLSGSSTRWQVTVVMPLAVLAVTATAPNSDWGPAVTGAQLVGGRVLVFEGGEKTGVPGLTSDDGGKTWQDWYGPVDRPSETAACLDRRCYRVMPGKLGVEESGDGGRTWRVAWEPTTARVEWLNRKYADRAYAGQEGRAALVRSFALVVQERPGGHVVVVANGADGILVRETSGEWREVGWPGGEWEPDTNPLAPERDIAISLAAVMALGLIGTGLRRLVGAYTIFAALTVTGLYVAMGAQDEYGFIFYFDPAQLTLGLAMMFIGGLTTISLAGAGRPPARVVGVALVAGPLTYATVFFPFLGWSQGFTGPYLVAVAWAVVCAGGVLAGSVALIRRDASRLLDGDASRLLDGDASRLLDGFEHVESDERPKGLRDHD